MPAAGCLDDRLLNEHLPLCRPSGATCCETLTWIWWMTSRIRTTRPWWWAPSPAASATHAASSEGRGRAGNQRGMVASVTIIVCDRAEQAITILKWSAIGGLRRHHLRQVESPIAALIIVAVLTESQRLRGDTDVIVEAISQCSWGFFPSATACQAREHRKYSKSTFWLELSCAVPYPKIPALPRGEGCNHHK